MNLRLKLLITIFTIVSTSTVSFYYFATDMIRDDKIAYIYNTSLESTMQMNQFWSSDLEHQNDWLNLLSFNKENDRLLLSAISKKIISKNERLLSVTVNDKKNIYEIFNIKDKVNKDSDSFHSSNNINLQRNIYTIHKKFNRYELNFKFTIHPKFLANLKKKKQEKVILSRKMLLKDSKTPKVIIKQIKSGQKIATFETAEYLHTIYPISQFDFFIKTKVQKSIVFKALHSLRNRSIVFLLMIISISGIISILLTSKLTKSIEALSQSVSEYGEGNLDTISEVKSNDEVGVLSQNFNSMAKKIKALLVEIKQYNENLEKLVDERTRQLKESLELQQAMIDSVDQGFFIINNESKFMPIYSKATLEMYPQNFIKNNFPTAICITKDEEPELLEFIEQLFSEMIPFKDLVAAAPQDFTNSKNQFIHLKYFPIRNEDNKIKNIVIVSSNKTMEVEAQKAAQYERSFTKRVLSTLKSPQKFLQFYKNFKMQFELFSTKQNIDKNEVLSVLHGLKGTSSLFHFNSIADEIHLLETELKDTENISQKNNYIKEKISSFVDKIEEFINSNSKVLKVNTNDLNNFTIDITKNEITELLEQTNKIAPKFTHFLEAELLGKKIDYFISPFNEFCSQLAMTQNKEILPIVIENHDCRFLIEYYTPLFDSLIHIFTNIVDHGIEKKEIRAEQNKRIQGLISVKALRNLKDKTNQITITDDGSGIDIDKIKAKALEGEIIKDDFLPDEKVLELIFHPGFTTNDTVSLNSGRGIGLFQVRQEVEKLDGKIRVITRKSIGTQFLIELPII